jgi:hypothetical protein
MTKPGRNDPCPCGSGKKYKMCCLTREQAPVAGLNWRKMRRTEGELVPVLVKHAGKYYDPDAVVEAWDDFSLWNNKPMDPESEPELDTIFLPWFVFNWIPGNAGIDAADHYPEMPVARHYLAERGSSVDSFQRRFIEECCAQPYSFFLVKDIQRGKRMTLRDLLLEREVSVHERQATTILHKGAVIYTRIITLDAVSIMVGCAPAVIPSRYVNNLIDLREELAKKFPGFDRDFLLEYDIELRTVYYDIRDELFNRPLPELRNTDGEPLQLTTLHYTLKCTPREALDALAALSLEQHADEIIAGGEFDRQGELVAIEFPWLKRGNKQHAGWDNTVMGHINIDGGQLTIDVNSQERADTIKAELAKRLGELALFRNAVIQSPEKMLEDLAGRPSAERESAAQRSAELQALPEVREQLQEMARRHWETWLETPLPALKDQTPREAAKTALGRERLDALLLEFEGHDEAPQPFQPDVRALRQSLGME